MSFISVRSGEAFDLQFGAVDAAGFIDMTFTGTLLFSSSDPRATLPESYTLVLSDRGDAFIANSAVLRTPGDQTITVRDSLNRLTPGTLTLLVYVHPVDTIPTLSWVGRGILVLGLVVSGVWLLSR